jgi:hypothetical protein
MTFSGEAIIQEPMDSWLEILEGLVWGCSRPEASSRERGGGSTPARLLYLTGASGVGKSSLLTAWAIPKLERKAQWSSGSVHESIFQPQISDVTPLLLPRLISPHVTKVPRSIEDLAEGTGLTPRQIQGAMFRLGAPERAIVRPLDSAQTTWEISHDYLVPIIDSILAQWRPPALKTVLKWGPLAAACLVFLLVVVVPRLLPDPIMDLEAEGWAIQPGVLQPLVKGKFPISYGLTCNGCTQFNLDVSASDIRRLQAEIDIILTNISELDTGHLRGWSAGTEDGATPEMQLSAVSYQLSAPTPP